MRVPLVRRAVIWGWLPQIAAYTVHAQSALLYRLDHLQQTLVLTQISRPGRHGEPPWLPPVNVRPVATDDPCFSRKDKSY
jgi:hypothetical protein